jgi:hypothetical protein
MAEVKRPDTDHELEARTVMGLLAQAKRIDHVADFPDETEEGVAYARYRKAFEEESRRIVATSLFSSVSFELKD